MLAVTVMLVTPGGIKKLHLIEIQNDGTGTPAVGNYDVRLWQDGDILARTRVENHNRDNDAMQLVTKAILALSGPQVAVALTTVETTNKVPPIDVPVPIDDIEYFMTRYFFQVECGQNERLDRIFAWLNHVKPIPQEGEQHP